MVKKVGEKQIPLGEKETPLGEKVTKVGEKVNFVGEKKNTSLCREGSSGEAMPLDAGRVLLHVGAAATEAPVPLATGSW